MINTPVLGLASCHDRKLEIENAGTFIPPCCLVFVGQDKQSWVPGHLQIAMKKTLRSNREAWKIKSNRLEVLHFFRWFTHTHTWARKYMKIQRKIARCSRRHEKTKRPFSYPQVKNIPNQTANSEWKVLCILCQLFKLLENIPEWWLQTKEIEKDWKSMGKATPCYFNGALLTSCLSEDHYLSLSLPLSLSLSIALSIMYKYNIIISYNIYSSNYIWTCLPLLGLSSPKKNQRNPAVERSFSMTNLFSSLHTVGSDKDEPMDARMAQSTSSWISRFSTSFSALEPFSSWELAGLMKGFLGMSWDFELKICWWQGWFQMISDDFRVLEALPLSFFEDWFNLYIVTFISSVTYNILVLKVYSW